MTSQSAVNDNLNPRSDINPDDKAQALLPITAEEEGVISAAVLVVAAFRLRDETALVQTLRGLANCVANMEASVAA